jgi:prepilin-type processing-associated H-X9-DG protein
MEEPNQMKMRRANENGMRAAKGFAFIELLVVIAVIMLLAAMLLPTLNGARQQAASIQCLHNLKELSQAWNMYVTDHGGVFPYNPEGGQYGWIAGGEMNYSGSPDNTNLLDLTGGPGHNSQLGPYTSKQPSIFKCPADQSRSFGKTGAPRIRTYSMSAAIGSALIGSTTGQGAWLPSPPWLCFFKESDLRRPGPSRLWLFQEENPDSINDAAFQFEMPTGVGGVLTVWIDSPSKLHGNSGRFAFADGHSEAHEWRNPRGIPNVTYSAISQAKEIIGNADVWWVAARTSALASGAKNEFPSD